MGLLLGTLVFAACGEDSGELRGGGSEEADPLGKENATLAAGTEAVQKRRCVDCHDGAAGKMAGRSDALAYRDPEIELYPPNLTPDPETGIGSWTDDQLANAIRTGLDVEGLNLCPQMTHFAEMSDFEVYSIVMYLRSLPPVRNDVPRSVCPPLKLKEEQETASR
jgi:hypothetical protein